MLPIASGHNDDIGLNFGLKQSLLFYFVASPLSLVVKPALLVWFSPLPQWNQDLSGIAATLKPEHIRHNSTVRKLRIISGQFAMRPALVNAAGNGLCSMFSLYKRRLLLV